MGYFSCRPQCSMRALLNYYQHVCSCWTLSIWNFVLKLRHTYTLLHKNDMILRVCEWVNFPSAAWLCAVHVSRWSVDVCVYEKADLVMRWLQCWRFATNQDQQVWTQNLFEVPRSQTWALPLSHHPWNLALFFGYRYLVSTFNGDNCFPTPLLWLQIVHTFTGDNYGWVSMKLTLE